MDITAHICRRIRETPVAREPWPHLVVDEFLPPSVFDALLAAIPEEWARMPATQPRNWVGPDPDNAGALLHDDGTNTQYWRRSDLLLSVFDAFKRDSALHAAVNAQMETDIKAAMQGFMTRFDMRAMNVRQITRLVRDVAAYDLRPHTDAAAKLISVILYVRSDPGDHLGTILYQPTEAGFVDLHGSFHDPEDFKVAAEVAFTPNRALIFVRKHHTFHGVAFKPADPQHFARITLQSNLFMQRP